VTLRAAQWLTAAGIRSVVDVGAGPGKFCVAAALASDLELVGLEHRPRLVEAAQSLARLFDVDDRVCFVQGTLQGALVPVADAYYFYNPFAENLFGPGGYLAADVDLGCDRYAVDIAAAEGMLRRAPAGTVVVTYNGFGGRMPASYELRRLERGLPCVLSMWQKVRLTDDGGSSEPDAD
jgi:predicted O-methyltransferase YrrM